MQADLEKARLEAARILQEAAEEAERAEAAARQEGYERGRLEGLEAGQAEVAALRREAELALENARLQGEAIRKEAESAAALARLEAEKAAEATLAEARAEASRILAEARERAEAEVRERLERSQEALVELAVAAATRLVQGHLAVQPQAVVQMVAAGLRLVKDSPATVRVSPDDLPLLEAQRSTLERELGAGALTLTSDPGLSRGSYLVQTPVGQVDGTLEQQTARLQAAMRAALGGVEP
nr:FliH/SctL family protein [Symbiobacterium terraclitae]